MTEPIRIPARRSSWLSMGSPVRPATSSQYVRIRYSNLGCCKSDEMSAECEGAPSELTVAMWKTATKEAGNLAQNATATKDLPVTLAFAGASSCSGAIVLPCHFHKNDGEKIQWQKPSRSWLAEVLRPALMA